jgi:hypothetical protein
MEIISDATTPSEMKDDIIDLIKSFTKKEREFHDLTTKKTEKKRRLDRIDVLSDVLIAIREIKCP